MGFISAAGRRVGLVAALVVAASSVHGAGATPIAAFFASADVTDVRLSPSGRYLAMRIADGSGRMVLAVSDIETPTRLKVIANDPQLDIRSHRWVDDDWLILSLIDFRSGARDQRMGPGLLSVRRDGSQPRLLISTRAGRPMETGTHIVKPVLDQAHKVLFVPSDGGTEVIVGQDRFDNLGDLIEVAPKRLDVTNGRVTAIQGFPTHAFGWTFDAIGAPRAVQTRHDGIVEVKWLDKGTGAWRTLGSFSGIQQAWRPLAVDADDTLYVVSGSSTPTAVLGRFDFGTGKPDPKPIASAPGFDLVPQLLMDKGRLVGLRLTTDAETTRWFDPRLQALQSVADGKFPGRVNRIVCRDCSNDGALLVFSYADRDPGSYWIYRMKSQTWSPIGSVRPAIDPARMATLDLHRIKARDGEDLPVWVTTPPGESEKPRGAVVLVHGGPWTRGTTWEWEPTAQFLASRGYVVIEPEFRGSTGYGFDHFRKGWKAWGTSMQDDVVDAARWAASSGLVDLNRICIVGGSYGGYAVLMGAIREPAMYRCGVAFAAVTDPRLLFANTIESDVSREAREFSLPVLIGDPARDAELLKAASPVERAGEIRTPMLLAFGGVDRRVPIEHGKRIRAALQAAGQDPVWIVYEEEAHGWLAIDHRVDFWQRVEGFLARHLD